MGLFDWFKRKRPVDRIEGGEIDINAEITNSAETAIKEEKSRQEIEQEQENAKKEKMKRFIARISALMERVELLESKMNRVESRLGIKDETEER